MCFPLEKWSVQGSSHMVGCNFSVSANDCDVISRMT